MNRVDADESDVLPIEHNFLETGDAEVVLDVVDDVTGVDTPYKEYMDECNKDVLEIGDNAIDQYVCESDTGVHDAAADEAFGVNEAGDWEVEPISGDSDHTTLLPHPTATAHQNS